MNQNLQHNQFNKFNQFNNLKKLHNKTCKFICQFRTDLFDVDLGPSEPVQQ